MKEKTLTLLERIVLASHVKMFEGNYIEVITIRDLIPKLEPTQQEIIDFKITPVDKGLAWDGEADKKTFPYQFTTLENDVITKVIRKLDAEGKLNLQLVSLYEMFCKQG